MFRFSSSFAVFWIETWLFFCLSKWHLCRRRMRCCFSDAVTAWLALAVHTFKGKEQQLDAYLFKMLHFEKKYCFVPVFLHSHQNVTVPLFPPSVGVIWPLQCYLTPVSAAPRITNPTGISAVSAGGMGWRGCWLALGLSSLLAYSGTRWGTDAVEIKKCFFYRPSCCS